MSRLHFFECRECPGKTCHMQIESEAREVLPAGACTVPYPFSGTMQKWTLVETREVSDDVD